MAEKMKQNLKRNKKTIFVAMSGGVDSSVAAALLKKQGFGVVGVFMRFWKPRINADFKTADERGWENSCCSAESEAAARLVAGKLRIPFYIFNFAKEFKREVADYFLAETAAGRTPNPCVVCNERIKFGLFFEKALGLGADFVATGHYARVARKFKVQSSKFKVAVQSSKLFELREAEDKQKDQSYFLYRLSQRQLSRIIFPLGDLRKSEVVKIAKRWRLPYRQEESFDLCFTGGDTKSFTTRHLRSKAGKILDLSGCILGKHQSMAFYTLGQRVSLGGCGPFYVVRKDVKKNILYASNKESDLYSDKLVVSQISWLSDQTPKLPMKVWAKIRYRSETTAALIRGIASSSRLSRPPRNDAVEVHLQNSQRAITPGQSAVFYGRRGEVLGGGIIE